VVAVVSAATPPTISLDAAPTSSLPTTRIGEIIAEIEAIGRKAAAFRLDLGDTHSFEGFVADVRKMLGTWRRERFDYLVNTMQAIPCTSALSK
jgi:hypothetical protein